MTQLITSAFPLKEKTRAKPTQDGIAFLLLWIILWITARRLIVTNWTSYLGFTSTAVTLGLFFGLSLGVCQFRKPFKFILMAIYSSFLIIWLCGLTFQYDISWLNRLSLMLLRLKKTAHLLIQNQPVQDNLLFILLMISLYWFVGVNSGYSLAKNENTWRILVPLFFIITLIHSYDPLLARRIWYLVAFSIFSLFLIIRLNLIRQVSHWKDEQIWVPSQFSNDIFQVSIRFVILLSFIVWIVPTNRSPFQQVEIIWNKIKQPFQSIREDFENAFSSLKVSIIASPDYYGRILNLGEGNILSDEEVFSVLVPEKPPNGLRFYWRARAYNYYENGQWTTANTIWHSLEPGSTRLQFTRYPDRSRGLNTFYFAINKPIITIFVPPQPQWTNLGTKAELFPNPDGTMDILTLQSNNPLGSGTTYTVRSSLSGTTVEKLRQSSENFPPAIMERYLQIPDSITTRTRELAQQITADRNTEYDKVMAITEYLRQHIHYTDTLEALPDDQELIDWFLFDAKRGFCNYFASAEVILLRSIGIPARLAVGYAQGKMTSPYIYQVIQRDAHAWPEVYFVNIGWVEFEPTPNQPNIIRPLSDLEATTSKIPNESDKTIQEALQRLKESHQKTQPTPKSPLPTFVWLFILFIIVVGMIAFSYIQYPRLQRFSIQIPITIETNLRKRGVNPPAFLINWNRKQVLSPVEKTYLQINVALNLFGKPALPSATPTERANLLISFMPEAASLIKFILDQYLDYIFNNKEPDLIEISNVERVFRRTIYRKWLSQHLPFGVPIK